MNNRQSGRRRGRNNNNQRQQGQGRNHDQGNRIDNRARGNATQLLEKYRNMARDAQLSGDRVMMEYYLQFADHYFRVLSDARSRQEEARARSDDNGRDNDRNDNDRGDRGHDDQDGDDGDQDGDELDAIDTIGRAPRNRSAQRRNGGNGSNRRDEPRSADRDDDSDERSERADRGSRRQRSSGNGNGNGHAVSGIDAAILPPAIGGDTGRTAARASANDADSASDEDAPATPKRRGRARKADVAEDTAQA